MFKNNSKRLLVLVWAARGLAGSKRDLPSASTQANRTSECISLHWLAFEALRPFGRQLGFIWPQPIIRLVLRVA
ncbi:hypothetical protein BIW11_13500 [Tropilaelaps mercedesae]|uniref:Secreted protein n=1 Tax=Tropilaelaps mercedesae TaxID=418985 RepID=A0A1V9X1L0_9ACAR|nr:hypothetical protein BIW11_13500 [Tropilaelaps mercedesae]